MNKIDTAYKTIGEVVKILSLKNKSGKLIPTHTIRFWEKEFKQIKPKILTGNRRYYNKDTIEILKKVKYLLKDQGMTINGVKKLLNSNKSLKLDELSNNHINADNKIRIKLKKISNIIKQIKPKILSGNRRYYDSKAIEVLKKVKYLLKDQGMTINGVKKLLNTNPSLKLDEFSKNSISVDNSNIKNKLKKILNLIKEIKKLK